MKSIILAWWYWTRMLPISKVIPKEMMPIWDQPTIQYIVDWATSCWIKDIIILLTKNKKMIQNRFEKNDEIENMLIKSNKIEMLEKIQNPQKIANYTFLNQLKWLGTWWAILQCKQQINEKFFMVNFWDAIYDKKDFQMMIQKFQQTQSPIIWISPQPIQEASNHWVAKLDWEIVLEIEESRNIQKAPSNYIRDGFCILPNEIFDILEDIKKQKKWSKFRLADWINILAQKTKIYWLKIDSYRDIWNTNKRLKANNNIYQYWKLF